MNLHPALLAVIVVDGLSAITLIIAGLGAIRIVLGWNDESASRTQLALERLAEEVSALARVGLGFNLSASILLIIVINHVLPSIVPGAMCGVGALQAMPSGTSALALRGFALGGLWVWAVIDKLHRKTPLSPLPTVSARALLVTSPVALVAAWQTGQALLHVDVQQSVSCCAAVYDLATLGEPAAAVAIADMRHVVVVVACSVLIVVGGLLLLRKLGLSVAVRATLALAWAAVVVPSAGLAGWVLVDVAGPYLYGVLGHRCPFCFFMPHHGAIGYALYGSLTLLMAETLRVATAAVLADRFRSVRENANRLVRRGVITAMASMLIFALLVSGPVLVWRVRFGVWIDG